MNEIITKLNEIEEKAGAILSDASSRREQLLMQLEKDKREIDAKYDWMEEEAVAQLGRKLRDGAKAQLQELREKSLAAAEQLDVAFEEQKEGLAEEIVKRVTG